MSKITNFFSNKQTKETSMNVITKASKSDDQTTNLIIRNVEFFWAKLGKPVENQFSGDMQWELQIRVPTKRRADIEELGTVKHPLNANKVEDTSMCYVNLRKKATKADGSSAQPVRVVDAAKQEIDGTTLGNGSKGHVIVMRKPFEIKNAKTGKVTKTGISTALSAVQVIDLIEFKGTGNKITDMFDEEGPAVKQTDVHEDGDF